MIFPFKRLSSKAILIIVSALILMHLVALSIYTLQTRFARYEVNRDHAIQQVMNTIHMIQATPEDQLAKALEAHNERYLTVTLNKEPTFELRFNEFSYWQINRKLTDSHVNDHSQQIELSIQLTNGHWLNIQRILTAANLHTQLFLILAEAFIAFIVLFYAWSINRFTQPLRDFRQAAERLGVDVNTQPLVEYGPSVVRETAQAMNKMQQRIRDLIRDRTQMLAAISHDLRTPLTRLKLRAQSIENKEQAEKIVRDLDEMESMIAESLAFAREGMTDEKKVKLDLNALIGSICDNMTDLGNAVTFEITDKQITYSGRVSSLRRAFTNLIQNAIKYGHIAHVQLTKIHHKIKVVIEDKGPGIPESELLKVFAPFYRCDQSRSREIAGTGLGLAVASDVIRAHKGEIVLENIAGGGLRVIVTL